MPEQNETTTTALRPGSSPAVMGLFLVLAGVALLLDRTGVLPAAWQLTLWPVLLMGYGAARLAQPRPSGRRGLFFVLAGLWWLAAVSGWVSPEGTWPLLLVAFGVSLVVQSVTATGAADAPFDRIERRHGGYGWILPFIIVGAVLSSGFDRNFHRGFAAGTTTEDGRFRSTSVMGRRSSHLPATATAGGEMTVVMGESALDLRDVKLEPGATMTVHVVTVMGNSRITVPDNWVVDIQAAPVAGRVGSSRSLDDWSDQPDDRSTRAQDSAAPRLIIRGIVMFGRLDVRS